MNTILWILILLSVTVLILSLFAQRGHERFRRENPYRHQSLGTKNLRVRRSRWPLTGKDDPRRFTYYWYRLPDGNWTFEIYRLDGTTETGPVVSRKEFEQRAEPWITRTEDGEQFYGNPDVVRYYPQSSVYDYIPYDR